MNKWISLQCSFNSEGLSDGPKPPEPKNVSIVHNLMRDAPTHNSVSKSDETKRREQGNARMRKWRAKG